MKFSNPAFEPLSSDSDDENTLYAAPTTTHYGTLSLIDTPTRIDVSNLENIELQPLNNQQHARTQTLTCWGDPYSWCIQRKHKVLASLLIGGCSIVALYLLCKYLLSDSDVPLTTTFSTSTKFETTNPTTQYTHTTLFTTQQSTSTVQSTARMITTQDTTAMETTVEATTTGLKPDPRCVPPEPDPICCDKQRQWDCGR